MTTNEWIGLVDNHRTRGGLLAFGAWHGYTRNPETFSHPMRGEFYLVRWKAPTIAVSHDDPMEALELAKSMERGMEVHRPVVVSASGRNQRREA